MSKPLDPGDPKRRRRLLLISIAIFLIVIGLTASILKINEMISNLGAVFTILGVLLPVLHRNIPSTGDSSASLSNLMTNKRSHENASTEIEGVTPVMFGLTRGMGALLICTNSDFLGSRINLTFGFDRPAGKVDIVEQVDRHKMNGRSAFVAIFRQLPPGNYTIYMTLPDKSKLEEKITLNAGDVKKVDWRRNISRQRQINMAQVRIDSEA